MYKKEDATQFGQMSRKWFQSIQPRLKESTCNKYINLLEWYILPVLEDIPIHKISHEILESFCRELLTNGGVSRNGLSPKTVSDSLSVIREILQYAASHGESVSCNTRTLSLKPSPNRIRVLSRGEQKRLCRYLYSDLTSCNIGILVCLFTGLRVGEICALRWEDISLTEGTIYIHRTLQRIQDKSGTNVKTKIIITQPKSSCSIRTIPIMDNLLQIIGSHQTSSTGYFLTNSTLKYLEPRIMQYHFKSALKKCSIESAGYHTLRHTFATRCVELGFDIKCLSEILGHANVNITLNRYVHPSMELKTEYMQRLSELLILYENEIEKD